MSRRLHLIKSSRGEGNKLTLCSDTVLRKLADGIETSVIFDLNVLNYMRDVLLFDFHGLCGAHSRPFYDLCDLLKTNGIFIVPGFALGEADEKFREELMSSYENFVAEYAPSFVNSYNHTELNSSKGPSRIFSKLAEGEQLLISVSYLSMLKIYQIQSECKSSTGYEKFDIYMEFMDNLVSMVGAFEVEVAKHSFSDAKTGYDDFDNASKIISDNFKKSGSGEKKLMSLLNQSRDLMYLRIPGLMSDYDYDERLQECWLVTLDEGLFYLSQNIYFHPKDGFNAMYVHIESHPARSKSSYWKYVDNQMDSVIEDRFSKGISTSEYHASEPHLKEILKLTKELESWVLSFS
ncbi:hypothetical protein [uncultured Deefgea sp.]|uniref:hypothetical protein n=1 Tax=uncultured Deefgea sp. TaxID=1304914 RepID=UPI00262E82E5|nr:hypothetical protein [uncultured Deefgea sp.]